MADPVTAFAAYEKPMRPFAEEGQNVQKLLPRLLWPHSEAGLAAMRIASTPLVRKMVGNSFARDSDGIDLPRY